MSFYRNYGEKEDILREYIGQLLGVWTAEEMAELFDQKLQQCVAERERVIKEVGSGRD